MHRFLVGVAVGAVVLAVGAVVLVAVQYAGRSAGTAKPPETAAALAAQAPAIPERQPVERPDPLGRPTKPKARPEPETPDKAEAQDKAEVAAAPGTAAAEESPQDKADRILADLNSDEQRALMRTMFRRMAQRRRERRKYELPSDRRLRSLERSGDQTLKISDAQRDQIEALKNVMKPKIEAAMQDIWAQQEELRQQALQLMAEGNRDEARNVWRQFGPLREQASAIQAPLDEEYKTSLSAILSPEQMAVVEQTPEPLSRGRRGMRFGGPGGRD